MSTLRRELAKAVKDGRLREQCAHCEHGQKHHDAKARRCNVCWDFCEYEPAWVIERARRPLSEGVRAASGDMRSQRQAREGKR